MSPVFFVEPDEFENIRRELDGLRTQIESMSASSGPVPSPAGPEQIHHRDLQLLLLHIRYQNSRAKMLLSMMPPGRNIANGPANRDQPPSDVRVDLYTGCCQFLD
jgi:hypothetical protein